MATFQDTPLYDTFTRSEVSGLGVADSGHSWSTVGNWSVDGAAAVASLAGLGGTTRALVSTSSSVDRNVDMRVTFRPVEAPVGGNLHLSLIARLVGTDYTWANVIVVPDGTTQIGVNNSNVSPIYIAGPDWTGETVFNVRFWFYENQARMKVWFGDSSEPTNWTYVNTVNSVNTDGQSGFETTLYSNASNTLPYLVGVDPVKIYVSVLPRDINDTFSRDYFGGLGAADSGHVYTNEFGSASDWSVSLTTGEATANLDGSAAKNLIMSVGDNFSDVRGELTAKTVGDTNEIITTAGFHLRHTDTSNYIWCTLSFNHATDVLTLFVFDVIGGSTVATSSYSFGAFTHDTYYKIKAEVLGSNVRAKVWLASATEPVDWHISRATTVPRLELAVALRATRDTSVGSVTSSVVLDSFVAQDIALRIDATVNDNLDSPGVQLILWNGNLYPTVRVDRVHVNNLYETQTVRGLANIATPGRAYLEHDYEMPLDEDVIYTVYALDDNDNVVSSAQSEAVSVEVPYHRVIIRSVGSPALSRRVQITEFKEFSRALRIIQESQVLGVQDPVITFDVMEGMTGTFTCMNILDQDAAGLALRDLFFDGQPLMFQSVMRNSGTPDFYFLATQVVSARKGAIGNETAPRFLYTIEFREIARTPADISARGIFTWQTLLDVEHLSWQSVNDTHESWLTVFAETDRPPA